MLARRYATTRPAMIVAGGSSMYKGTAGWQASRANACLPALTGQLGIAGGGLGPRHGTGTHFTSITGDSRRPAGRYVPNQMSRIADALGDGTVRVLLLAGTDMTSSFGDAARVGEGARAARPRRELRPVHERHGAAVRAHRAAGNSRSRW